MRIRSIGDKGVHNKSDWLKESQVQLRSSQMLRKIANTCLSELQECESLTDSKKRSNGYALSLIEDRHAANQSSYLLLGYSFELLLKAGVLSIYVGLSKELFDNEIKTKFGHDLMKMANELSIDLDDREVNLLTSLRDDITNTARYPVKANSNEEYCTIKNANTNRHSSIELYQEYLILYERIKSLILLIDSTSKNPKLSFEVRLDDDGYFIYRIGGNLPTMMIYRYSQWQSNNGEDNKDSLFQLLTSELEHPAFKQYIARDWENSRHFEHRVSRKSEKLVSS